MNSPFQPLRLDEIGLVVSRKPTEAMCQLEYIQATLLGREIFPLLHMAQDIGSFFLSVFFTELSKMPSQVKTDKYPRLSRSFESMKPEYDVLVIGSGYGAGVTASRMARAGKSVAVLELGWERRCNHYPGI